MKRTITMIMAIIFLPIIFMAFSVSFVRLDLGLLNPLNWNEAARVSIVMWVAFVGISLLIPFSNSKD